VLTPAQGRRNAYFDGRMTDTPVVGRAALAKRMQGPLIVEEFDATCVVPPGASAELDAHGNIVIDAEE
jgi:N-methylhydantoinase A